jgi:hypothetical protein
LYLEGFDKGEQFALRNVGKLETATPSQPFASSLSALSYPHEAEGDKAENLSTKPTGNCRGRKLIGIW